MVAWLIWSAARLFLRRFHVPRGVLRPSSTVLIETENTVWDGVARARILRLEGCL